MLQQIIDRRLSGKNKSVGNRERFLRRHKEQIKEAVRRAIDGAAHGFLDLLLVAAQESLSVAHRFVLAGQPPVNDLLKQARSPLAAANRAPGRPKAGSHPLGGSAGVPDGRGAHL